MSVLPASEAHNPGGNAGSRRAAKLEAAWTGQRRAPPFWRMSVQANSVLMDKLRAPGETLARVAARWRPIGVGTACPSIEPSILLAMGD